MDKMYISFHHKRSLFGKHIFTPYASDIYGEQHQNWSNIPVDEKEKLADYLTQRGFKLRWSHGKHLRHLREFEVVIKDKAQLAQFALINVGVIEIEESKPKKKTIFKI